MAFARHFFLPQLQGEYHLTSQDWGTNQISQKAIFTCVVYTNIIYFMHLIISHAFPNFVSSTFKSQVPSKVMEGEIPNLLNNKTFKLQLPLNTCLYLSGCKNHFFSVSLRWQYQMISWGKISKIFLCKPTPISIRFCVEITGYFSGKEDLRNVFCASQWKHPYE